MSDESDFWETIDLLLAVEGRKSEKDLKEEADDWAERVVTKKNSLVKVKLLKKNSLQKILKSSRSESTLSIDFEARLDEVEKFIRSLDLPQNECKFSPLAVRTKLEMLMGSNLVSLTDRNYMIYLQERILDDYDKAVTKRINIRQAEEMERVKNLVLCGKIPLDEAPIEMANHPVMLIDQYCKKVLAERRAKMKVLRPFIPKHLYWDDTPDPQSGLSIETGHSMRPNNERLCLPPDLFLSTEDSENMSDGYMLNDEEYAKLHYETDQIKELRDCETVEQMYRLADQIIGIAHDESPMTSVHVDASDISGMHMEE